MGTEIATIAEQETASLMPLLMRWETEASLSDEQFRAVAAFAAAPPPVLPLPTPDEFRELIAFLAGSLKAPRTGVEAGKIKLGAYRLALDGIPKAAITHAVQVSILTLEWLPAPAELLKLARSFTAPEQRAHERAKAMTFARRQRLFDQTLRNIRERKLLTEELTALDDHTAKVAETQGTLIIRLDGSRQYRDKETLLAHMAEMQERASTLRDERDKRAEEPQEGRFGGGSVGDVAADLLAGMEVKP